MNFRAGLLLGLLLGLGIAGLGWFALERARSRPAASKSAPPVQVARTAKQEEFNTIVLDSEAEKRLGVRTVPLERRRVRSVRLLGGEVVVPAGKTFMVSAPLPGIIHVPPRGIPEGGAQVKKGQVICQLIPLLSPESRATLAAAQMEAEGQVNAAEAQVEVARIALERARRLLQGDAGSQRSVDEAQAQYDVAVKTREAAVKRHRVLDQTVAKGEKGTATPLPIEAPQDGVLRQLTAREGQTVPAGGALFEVVDVSRLWVRVPVYVGDVEQIAPGEARIGGLTIRPGQATRAARPIAAPPSANALAATVDLYYSLDNSDAQYRPGQRVGVQLELAGSDTQSLVVPNSALIHDINGGTWIYERTAPHTYSRRRVQVRHVTNGEALLASGPPVGSVILTEGAAELFGAEVGFAR